MLLIAKGNPAAALAATSAPRSVPISPRSWMTATAVILLLFVVSATASALRKPVTEGFDEVAHVSYVAHLQNGGAKWPGFSQMRMMDPVTFQFDSEPNYLNHPPFYYWLMAALGPELLQHPESLTADRLLNVALVTVGLAVLLVLARRMKLDQTEFYAFAAMIAATPVLASLAGSVNNDNLGVLGGAFAILGLYAYVASSSRAWLIVACGGLLAASAAKLTGLLLVGTMLAAVTALLAMRRKMSVADMAIVVTALALAASPYLVFVIQYGSPAPNTAGQSALLANGAAIAGWADRPRMDFPTYALFFMKMFLREWMPVLKPRSPLQLALLVLPAAVVLISVAGWIVSTRSLFTREARPADFIIVGGMTALAVTLAIHIGFSYERHLQTGWMMDAYPRYYLPLIAIVPMAALAGSAAVLDSRLRQWTVCFLVAAPILFGLLGSPIG